MRCVAMVALVMVTLVMGRETQTEPATRQLPRGLKEVEAAPVPTDGLAPGSAEAQKRQQEFAAAHGLPVEVENTIGMRFRLIPPGEFMMGSPDSEIVRDSDEGPQHRVQIAYAFYTGAHEVTQGQWEEVMGSGEEPSRFKNAGKSAPVETVSWQECQSFIENLCGMEGLPAGTYRLLTEAEWEYACRAGTTGRFYAGENDSDLDRTGWYTSNSGGTTHPAGQKLPNAWGLDDMHGNLWEWCEDDWHGSYGGAPSDGRAWVDSSRGSVRVGRGGSWGSYAVHCRSANRNGYTPVLRMNYLGLRLARQIPGASAE